MEINREQIVTQEETGEPALIEVADEAAEKKMRELEEEAKRSVEEGLEEQD
jgi:hypothetical protein